MNVLTNVQNVSAGPPVIVLTHVQNVPAGSPVYGRAILQVPLLLQAKDKVRHRI